MTDTRYLRKAPQIHTAGKTDSLTNNAVTTCYSDMNEWSFRPVSVTLKKVSSKWMKEHHVKPDTLRMTVRRKDRLCPIRCGNRKDVLRASFAQELRVNH